MKFKALTVILVILLFCQCQDHEGYEVPENLEVNDFIWKGMNLYYLWQPEVADLDDGRFANQTELNEFLAEKPSPVGLFLDLLTNPEVDRFSRIYSDYSVLEGVLSGTTKNNGVDYELRLKAGSDVEVFGWVRYILPNSDAASKPIERGDIFYAVNGDPLTINNYRDLLSQESYTLNLADYSDGAITPNGMSVNLTKTVISENPVFRTDVIETNGHKIGYLMYNGFYPNFEIQLNDAFAELKSQGVTELVLDLRYNSGGSIATATNLASMITGQFDGEVFAREQWNPKVHEFLSDSNPESLVNRFQNSFSGGAVTSLNLSKVYVLTSRSTASASELVINCLEPYIDVVQIGDKTTGKNVGSVTLYDSANFKKQGVNPSHRYAMQPIVLQVVNKNGFGDYHLGLLPDQLLTEDLGNLGILGNPDEKLLNAAIFMITGDGRREFKSTSETSPVSDSKAIDGLRDQMYVELP